MKTQYTSTLTRYDKPDKLYNERIDELNRLAAFGWILVSTVATGFDGPTAGGRYLDTFVRTV